MSHTGLSEVFVVLPTDTSHCLLEASQLILEVSKTMFQDV